MDLDSVICNIPHLNSLAVSALLLKTLSKRKPTSPLHPMTLILIQEETLHKTKWSWFMVEKAEFLELGREILSNVILEVNSTDYSSSFLFKNHNNLIVCIDFNAFRYLDLNHDPVWLEAVHQLV